MIDTNHITIIVDTNDITIVVICNDSILYHWGAVFLMMDVLLMEEIIIQTFDD